MASHTNTGPFLNGSAPGISDAFLNSVENDLVAAGAIYLITPNNIVNSVAFTSGQVQTFTATGVGGIPSGAKAILIGANFNSATTGCNITFYPNGGTTGQYWALGNIVVASTFCNGFGVVPLDGTGKFNIKSNAGASTVSVWVFGYII